jgi:hypothetical protein
LTTTWLDDVVAVYGEPRVSSDKYAEPPLTRDDEGPCRTRFWVWFPSDRNHNISIKAYGDGLRVVAVRSHLRAMASVEWRGHTEPDDALMRSLLALTGFLSTPPLVDTAEFEAGARRGSADG